MKWPFQRRKPNKEPIEAVLISSHVPASPESEFRLGPGERKSLSLPPALNFLLSSLEAAGHKVTMEQLPSIEMNGERLIEVRILADGDPVASVNIAARPAGD